MANFYAADFGKKLVRANTHGNGFNESYRYVFTAIAAASVIYFGMIPAGVEINGVKYVWDGKVFVRLSELLGVKGGRTWD